jgi:hypothetical protein
MLPPPVIAATFAPGWAKTLGFSTPFSTVVEILGGAPMGFRETLGAALKDRQL